jgi:hypothetical protein
MSSIHVKEQIPEIMVPVGPGSAVIIENTVNRIGRQILHAHQYGLVALDHLLDDAEESVVIHHLGKSLAHPMTCFWPSNALRKPASHVYFDNFCVLLGEDRANGTTDPLRQPPIRFATMEEIPRIALARNHLANVEPASRDEEDSWRLI